MAVYAVYNDMIVEVLERKKSKVLIKTSKLMSKWVPEKEIELWRLGNATEMVENARGHRKAYADAQGET